MRRFINIAVPLGLFAAWVAIVYPANRAATQPIYIDSVRVEFTDGESWATSKPVWRVMTHGTNGITDRRIFPAAAPATTQP